MSLDLSRHPCFNAEKKHAFARIHLPVAPKCNIQCNFCNRKYDCVNESRPGVTSSVLSPAQVLAYLEQMVEKEPRIAVVGIAGPGDPFANAQETMETLRLVRGAFPEMLLCVASNGLEAAPFIPEMVELDVTHLTVTCCGVDPEVVEEVYAWVRTGKKVYRGRAAGELMLERQLAVIRTCKQHGLTVKVNMIIIPGVNDHHVEDLARAMADLDVDILNCMGLCHVPGTPFEIVVPPADEELHRLRDIASQYLPQMKHCTRCRADAVGLLGQDLGAEAHSILKRCAAGPLDPDQERPYVAVASMEGMLVNQHLGEAKQVWIFKPKGEGFVCVEKRRTPSPGGGDSRWEKLGHYLKDCRALLVSEAGQSPREVLKQKGVSVYRTEGLIDYALEALYAGQPIKTLSGPTRCGSGCGGDGLGCA